MKNNLTILIRNITPNEYKYMIDTMNITAHLIGTEDFANKSTYQLSGIVAMYCSGIDEVYSYTGKVGNDIFKFYSQGSVNIYTPNFIKEMCHKYNEKLKYIRFDSVYNYMSMETISNLKFDEFKTNVNTDLYLFYNNPKSWVNKYYPSNLMESQSQDYVFPFKEEENTFGGKTRKKYINKRKTKSNKKTKTRKYKKKRTKQSIKNNNVP